MRRIFACAGIMLSYGVSVWAGKGTLALPVLERSAASAALGDGAAHLSGVSALGTNPAGLQTNKKEFSTQFQQLPADVSVGGAAFAFPWISANVTLGMSYSSLRSDNLEKRSETGEAAGSFSHQDQMISLHASRPLRMGNSEMLSGVSAKLIQSRVDTYSGSGFAFDGGLRYGFKKHPLTLAATALNLGKGPELKEEASPLPTTYALSGSYRFQKHLTLVSTVSLLPNEHRSGFSLGAEYGVADRLALRGRYALASGQEGGTDIGDFAGGIGLRLGMGTLDYTFQPYTNDLQAVGASGSHRATLTLSF